MVTQRPQPEFERATLRTAEQPRQIARDALIRFNLTVDDWNPSGTAGFGQISNDNPVVRNGFFAGGIRTFTPPEFKQKSAPWPTLGDGQMKVDIGIEEMPLVFTPARYHPGIRALYGKLITVEIRAGLWQGDTRRHQRYRIQAKGQVEQVTPSQVTVGELPDGMTVMLNCLVYGEWGPSVNGDDEHQYILIDIPNFKRIIDGEDQLEHVRSFFFG